MSPKFKIGDRVKCIAPGTTIYNGKGLELNKTYIVNIVNSWTVSLRGWDFNQTYGTDRFILAEKKENPTYAKCLEILNK